jgi:hypothetical protein
MSQRQLKRAANLLLDSVATFTTYELFTYEKCVFYAVAMAIVTLDRSDLRKKVPTAPRTFRAAELGVLRVLKYVILCRILQAMTQDIP